MPLTTRADAAACADEQIHLLGTVQPYGALLALEPVSLLVRVASESCQEVLGVPAAALLGRPLVAALPVDQTVLVAQTAADLGVGEHALLPVRLDETTTLDVTLHRSDGLVVLDCEPGDPAAQLRFSRFYAHLHQAMHGLRQAATLDEVCGTAAGLVRRFTGYDRVLVYRFREDGAGEVVAEDRRADLEPFLGLRYPAGDIPAQARALYERNWIRTVAAVDDPPSPLRTAPGWTLGRPLDLSVSVLRSVSEVHLEYLRNMGVAASASVSLLRDGHLWGLIACHHTTPRRPTAELRAAAELLGVTVSLQLAALEEREASTDRAALGTARGGLVDGTAAVPGIDGPVSGAATLADMVRSDGATIWLGGDRHAVGRVPTEAGISRILRALPPLTPGDPWSTDCLGDLDPDLADLASVASGLLAVRLRDSADPDFLLWFRGEVTQTVRRAGNPAKAPGPRLAPRASFALWVQSVAGHSLPWAPAERAAASEVWRSVAGVLLRGISYNTTFVLRGADGLDALSRDRLGTVGRLAGRMDALLTSLLDYARIGQLEPVMAPLSLDHVLDDVLLVLGPRIAEGRVEIRRLGPLPTVNGDAVRLSEVMANLVSNAVKYRDPGGTPYVAIGVDTVTPPGGTTAVPAVFVRDNGIGVPVQAHDDIFQIFRRLHPADRYSGGAGAGLTIARRIVERHGGQLWLTSTVGVGSTFWFTVPGPP